MRCLLRIVVGEQDLIPEHGVYNLVKKHLWKYGFPGLTIRRGEMSLDGRGMIHDAAVEDTAFNDLPIILESVVDYALIESCKSELVQQFPHGQISVVHGVEENEMNPQQHYVIKIYTKERNTWFHETEYEKVLQFLKSQGVIWATITKGIAGYGKDRVIHRQNFFSPSQQLPIVIECIVPGAFLPALLEQLKSKLTEGAIFTKSVDLVQNT